MKIKKNQLKNDTKKTESTNQTHGAGHETEITL